MTMNLPVSTQSVNKISKPLAIAAERIGRAVQYQQPIPYDEWRWAIWEASDLPPVARSIGLAVGAHDWHGEPRPTRKRLALMTGYTERAVQKNMKFLSGWLVTSGELRRRGRATEYALKVPPEFLAKFCPQASEPIQVPPSWRSPREGEPRAPYQASPSRFAAGGWDSPPPMASHREHVVLPIEEKGEPDSPYQGCLSSFGFQRPSLVDALRQQELDRENHVLPIEEKGEPDSPYPPLTFDPVALAAFKENFAASLARKGEPYSPSKPRAPWHAFSEVEESGPYTQEDPYFEASDPSIDPGKGEPGSPHLKQKQKQKQKDNINISELESLEEFKNEKKEGAASEEVSLEAPAMAAPAEAEEAPVEAQEAPSPTEAPKEPEEAPKAEPVPDNYRELLEEAAGPALASQAGAPRLMVLSEPLEWLRKGYSLRLDILPTVAAAASKKQPGEIRSWLYFDTAVANAHRNRKDKEKKKYDAEREKNRRWMNIIVYGTPYEPRH